MNAIGHISRIVGGALSVLALAAPAVASQPGPAAREVLDIYIGTLEMDGSAIVLRRCDLAENRYVLVDAPGFHAVAAVRKARMPAYGEVIASYGERRGHAILLVESIDNLRTGRNCHLLDALDAADKTLSGATADLKMPALTKSYHR